MIVYTKRIELPDNATYEMIEDAKITADRKGWNREEVHPGKLSLNSKADLHNKCGSCVHFQYHIGKRGGKSKGFCKIGGSGLCRTYKACKYYQERKEDG